ncbi:MAG: sugar transporter inner rane binding protein [Thermomicrobiales bacterium]|jgi:ABC-type glycerol-3-phosphate transport system permease component|nr:sugar transporter inner rane binding protein [Thermomicrobiales bacterium]
MQRANTTKGLVLYPVFLLIAAVILYPLVWMTYSSFKENADIFANVFALPSSLYLGNYVTVFTQGAMGLYFRNSLFISVVSVAGLLVFSSLAAYAFASFRFRGSTPLFMILLLGLMVPPQALIISGFKLMSILNLIDTYWALIFTYFGWTSFGILVLRNFFQSVPRDVKDAARVDGAGHWQMFSQIMLPLARPSISTVAIFYFMWVWNEFIYPLVYMQTPEKYTIPLGVLFFNGRYTVEWGLQMAALAVATIVPLAVYYMFQKQFIRGILAGALKG